MSRVLWVLAIGVSVAATQAQGGPRPPAADGTSATNAARAVSAPAQGQQAGDDQPAALAAALGIEFVKGSTSTLIIGRGGKKYSVDLAARAIREVDPPSQPQGAAGTAFSTQGSQGSTIFQKNCASCHGPGGQGIAAIKTPDFTSAKVQASLTDQEMLDTITHGEAGLMMPAWGGKLSEDEIRGVQGFLRSLASSNPPPGRSRRRAPFRSLTGPQADTSD
jgi:mono/diheme cytochrome c family protein